MCGAHEWTLRERDRKAVADAAICQQEKFIFALRCNCRKKIRDRGACADDVAHPDAAVVRRREVTRLTGHHVMTHDADCSNAVMQPFEARMLELPEARRNEPTELRQDSIEPLMEPDV